jgi:hypothetical protein
MAQGASTVPAKPAAGPAVAGEGATDPADPAAAGEGDDPEAMTEAQRVAAAIDPDAQPGEPATGDPAPTDEVPEGFVAVELPNRNPGQEPVKIITDDPEVAERLRQVVNSFERRTERETHEEALRTNMERFEQERDLLRIDPFAFNEKHLTPDERVGVALLTLLEEKVWNAAGPDGQPGGVRALIERLLSDEGEVRSLRAELRAARVEAREDNRAHLEQEKADGMAAQQVLRAITLAVPPNLSGERRTLFINDARRAIGDHVRKHHVTSIGPLDVPVILASRLRAYDMDPEQVAASLRKEFTSRSSGGRPAASAPGRRLDGPALVKAAQAKKAVARVAPAGAGAAASTVPTPPKGAKLAEANAAARQFFGRRPL